MQNAESAGRQGVKQQQIYVENVKEKNQKKKNWKIKNQKVRNTQKTEGRLSTLFRTSLTFFNRSLF